MSAARPAATGQHFLRSPALAKRIVADAGVPGGALVFDIGAGFGRLTLPLLETGARVIAVEIDAKLARSLQRRCPDARVVCDDALRIPLPHRPFRVVANLPFGISTAMLRRLSASPYLERADLIVARGFALKSGLPVSRWLPRRAFMPPPSTDCAVLVLQRR
ncbi:MAG TPA: rRNA adenine N-6-methyltransferase family protein [Acidimicrobiales bacterium]|nr:rRNA adenine N-6-methyltransferase family protein [Acidimicrobiales bacterium]